MFFAGLDDDLRVADFFDFRGEHRAKLFASLGRDAAGAAVGDDAFGVERGEIGAGANVAGLQFHAEAERLDDAASDLKFQRIVAEQAEMSRPAAGRDAGRDGNHAALRGILRDLVEVWRVRRFERREIILFLRRDIAKAVEDDQRRAWFWF